MGLSEDVGEFSNLQFASEVWINFLNMNAKTEIRACPTIDWNSEVEIIILPQPAYVGKLGCSFHIRLIFVKVFFWVLIACWMKQSYCPFICMYMSS